MVLYLNVFVLAINPGKVLMGFNGRSLQDYHQVCVRMVHADYCGDGTSHTHDGTLINFYDRLGVRQQGVSPNMSFEVPFLGTMFST